METSPVPSSPSPTLPFIQRNHSSLVSQSDRSLFSVNSRLANSAKLRRQPSWSSQLTPMKQQPSDASVSSGLESSCPSRQSFNSKDIENELVETKQAWEKVNILTNDQYIEKKERLLKTSKLKKELEEYFDVETPDRIANRVWIETFDADYDTDLDTDLGSYTFNFKTTLTCVTIHESTILDSIG